MACLEYKVKEEILCSHQCRRRCLHGSDSFNRRANGGGPFYGLSSGPKRTGKGGDNQSSMPWTYNQGTASGGTACGRGKSGKPSDRIADYGACSRTGKGAAGNRPVGRGSSSPTMRSQGLCRCEVYSKMQRNYGFVEYTIVSDAEGAIARMNGILT